MSDRFHTEDILPRRCTVATCPRPHAGTPQFLDAATLEEIRQRWLGKDSVRHHGPEWIGARQDIALLIAEIDWHYPLAAHIHRLCTDTHSCGHPYNHCELCPADFDGDHGQPCRMEVRGG